MTVPYTRSLSTPASTNAALGKHATAVTIRDARDDECSALGELLVEAYSRLPGFPSAREQPAYYEMLAKIGHLRARPHVRVLVAATPAEELVGGVAYFGDMAEYASGGTAMTLKSTSGLRLLAVAPSFRGIGAGEALTRACVDLARANGHSQLVLHTTAAMEAAWRLYEKLGFVRSEDLDFSQCDLPVFGFRLHLRSALTMNPDQR